MCPLGRWQGQQHQAGMGHWPTAGGQHHASILHTGRLPYSGSSPLSCSLPADDSTLPIELAPVNITKAIAKAAMAEACMICYWQTGTSPTLLSNQWHSLAVTTHVCVPYAVDGVLACISLLSVLSAWRISPSKGRPKQPVSGIRMQSQIYANNFDNVASKLFGVANRPSFTDI